jgi:cathepsin A (carboxypeptidase C)
MVADLPVCLDYIDACYNGEFPAYICPEANEVCDAGLVDPYRATGRSVYDVRKICRDPLCYDGLGPVETFLNRRDTKQRLGVARDIDYRVCNLDVTARFSIAGDLMRPFHRLIPSLLEDGIRLLIYVGDADYICNWRGNKAWTLAMPWAGQLEFAAAGDQAWESLGEHAGDVRSFGGLVFLRVFGAGHMVPYDQPAHSLEMIRQWFAEEL